MTDYVGDTSHATQGLVDFAKKHFTAKSKQELETLLSCYSKRGLKTYADATLGWVFPDYEALSAGYGQYMPNWEGGVSYSTRLLGDERSAVIAMRNSPELFGGEIHALSAVDFDEEGKVVRWVDYWDSRHFGLELASQLRVPAEKFPESFGEDRVSSSASTVMRDTVDALNGALARRDAAAAAALFTVDASVVNLSLRSIVPGRAAIERFFERSARAASQGSGFEIRHVLGSDAGGGYEWTNPDHPAKRGMTALELDSNGLISSMIAVWDSAQVDDTSLKNMATLALEV